MAMLRCMTVIFPGTGLRNGNLLGAMLLAVISFSASVTVADDPYLWLEEVEGERALQWVAERNRHSLAILEGDERFEALRLRALVDYNAEDKIAYGTLAGEWVFNTWRDANNVRGLWRASRQQDYLAGKPQWREVLDIDRLAIAEGENWVFKGYQCLPPEFSRCLVSLSRGGGDAVVLREFDVRKREFVVGGFQTPESKQRVTWLDHDRLLIGTDFGPGTMNESGYPRQVRLWRRGQALADATLLINSDAEFVGAIPSSSHRPDGRHSLVVVQPDFFTQQLHFWVGDKLQRLDLPEDINYQGFFQDYLILSLRKPWPIGGRTLGEGAVLAVRIDGLLAGEPAEGLKVVFESPRSGSVNQVSLGRDRILLSVLKEVSGSLLSITLGKSEFRARPIALPASGSVHVVSSSQWSDAALVNFHSFLQPATLYSVSGSEKPTPLQTLPARFDATNLVTEQKFAISADGTRVPYYLIRHRDVAFNGKNPTLLYGYGGFKISLTPSYLSGVGKLWLEQGGVYVVANIRGGGEFGPAWHQAALKEKRQRAFDDFISVAEALIDSGMTSPAHLGIRGGSNGGLLVGVMLTQRPDLFNAVICAVPLLDMLRYHTLLAGASWVGEYGDPDDPTQRAYIEKYSPYHNLDEARDYPEPLIFTSTRDDRVHPGHARKMTARMMALGKAVLYYENTEGGHSAAANLEQRAYTDALQTVYALRRLAPEPSVDSP
jgi:prolyl oligopeptidase